MDFVREILGETGPVTAAQTEAASRLKSIVLQAFLATIENGLPLSASGFCTDTSFGESSILRAKGMGLLTGLSLDSSPSSWDVDSEVWDYSNKLEVPMIAVRVHYSHDGKHLEKKRLLDKLSALSKICRSEEKKALLVEIAPPLTRSKDENDAMMVHIIETAHNFLDAGVDASIWAIPPLYDATMATAAVSVFYIDDRSPDVFFSIGSEPLTGKVKSGARKSDLQIAELAARVEGVTGIFVGPGTYYQELVGLYQEEMTEKTAVTRITKRLTQIWNRYSNVAPVTE